MYWMYTFVKRCVLPVIEEQKRIENHSVLQELKIELIFAILAECATREL